MIIGPVATSTALKPTPKPPTASYRICRLPENGIESGQHEAAWAAQSDWLGRQQSDRRLWWLKRSLDAESSRSHHRNDIHGGGIQEGFSWPCGVPLLL
jgi:hypothetical protein